MKKETLKNAAGAITFLLLLAFVFTNLTWLFRTQATSRATIQGFHCEKTPIDVLFLGGSDVLTYYEPMAAWEQAGFTSYNYAVSASRADMLRFYAEDSRSAQKAGLYVFDLRTLPLTGETIGGSSDPTLRNWADSLSVFSPIRAQGIAHYLFTRNWREVDVPSYFLDISLYHSNYDTLSTPVYWKALIQRSSDCNKGFSAHDDYQPFLDTPVETDAREALTERQQTALKALLDYCDKEHLNALFFCSPILEDEDYAAFNTVGDYVRQRGYPYIDFNHHFTEMGLDPEMDFNDANHVSYSGAQKFTDYMTDYLTSHYDLPDHRGEAGYDLWLSDYEHAKLYREEWTTSLQANIDKHLEGKKIGETLPTLSSLSDWWSTAQNEQFTYVLKADRSVRDLAEDAAVRQIFSRFAADAAEGPYAGVWTASESVYASAGAEDAEVKIGKDGGFGQGTVLIRPGADAHLTVDGVEYARGDVPMQILVYDNLYHTVVDCVGLSLGENGSVVMSR